MTKAQGNVQRNGEVAHQSAKEFVATGAGSAFDDVPENVLDALDLGDVGVQAD